MSSLDQAMATQNALPNVLPHQRTQRKCDEISKLGEQNASIRLPVWAPSRTTGVLPEGAMSLDDLPFPSDEELRRHELKFMPSGPSGPPLRAAQAHHRAAVEQVRKARVLTEQMTGQKRKGRAAIRPQTTRSARRRTTPELVEEILKRHDKGMRPYPISVQLNVSEARVKKIIREAA